MFVLKPDYPALAGLSAALGLVVSALALPGVIRPARAAALWRRFPRSVWPGRAMAVVAIAWFVLWLPFILLEFAPALAPSLLPWLQVLFLALAAGTLLSLQELLSCRAAGMLLVLLLAVLRLRLHVPACVGTNLGRYLVLAYVGGTRIAFLVYAVVCGKRSPLESL